MGFLKTSKAALIGALSIIAAIFAAASAARHKKTAEKWRQSGEVEKIKDVKDGVQKAEAHFSQAKLHDAKAEEAKLKARDKLDRLGEQDEELADTVERWKRSNRMRNRS